MAAAAATTAHGYGKGDEIRVECTQQGATDKWISPQCIETDKPLAFYYGRDGPTQCSIKGDSAFHRAMLESIARNQPLRCQLARSSQPGAPKYLEFSLRVEGVKVRGSTKYKRINGNFNAVLHGQKGRLLAAAVYPVADQPLPEAVSGITTMQFYQRWYEGGGLSILMANRRHEEEFIIQPVVAIMFCILTACAMYVIGRVYVEGSLIPRVLAEHGIASPGESKKTQ
ncbi:hypothetical protein GGF46_001068 [Coemansia sp. RSA 552]|nr:hypothetical protein GGF46_001068 [Coemansia sp. RSA 552]